MSGKKLYYWKSPQGDNFGDMLNTLLFKQLFNIDFCYCNNIVKSDYIGIGSILDSLLYSENKIKYFLEFIQMLFTHHKYITILGAGFGCYHEKIMFRRKPKLLLVRGILSYNNIIQKTTIQGKPVFGDLGLLSSMLCDMHNMPEKKYDLGLIPHYNDLNSPVFFELYKKYMPNCKIINVRDDPLTIIYDIFQCKYIISSSLHGLIVSDSFHIPNLWVENRYKSQKVEDRFKYNDYYSIFNLTLEPYSLFDCLTLDIKSIANNYKISYNQVEEKKNELYTFCKKYFSNVE